MTSIDDFYEYLSKNDATIKYELRKNITYDDELFDDVYSSTVIKVHDAIERGRNIEDIRMYFFMAFKFNYIQTQNKQRKIKSAGTVVPVESIDAFDTEYDEGQYDTMEAFFRFMERRLSEFFDEFEVSLFVIYFRLKCGKGRISYRKLSEITGLSQGIVVSIIQKLKSFVRNDEKINEYKKKIYDYT